MKRYDAVKMIEHLIEHNKHNFHKENETFEVANIILYCLENGGMSPPGYLKPIPFIEGKQYPLVPGDFQREDGIWCIPGVQEWESD